MRILITNTGPWGTGSGTVADGVMTELKRRGHEVMAFFPDSGFPGNGYEKYYGDEETYRIVKFPVVYKGVPLYTFPLIIEDPNPRNHKDAWTFKDLSEEELDAYLSYMKEELEKVIADFKPDVIECQHIWALDHLLHQLDHRYICVAHHSDQLGFHYDQRMQQRTIQSAKKAAYIFAVSDYVKEEVLDLYDVEPEQVIVTGNGYDQTIFTPNAQLNRQTVMAEMGYPNLAEYPFITFCGKISKTKGIDVLLEANKLIQQKTKAYLLIMGSGNLDVLSNSEREKLDLENVLFLGQRSQRQLAMLHNIARLSVLPSRSEGFGIAALEAMGCKIPVVVTRVGGLSSFAVGKIVEPDNVNELAAGILEILNMDEELYRVTCQKAYTTAKHYSWENIVNIRMQYYQKNSDRQRIKALECR
ncbi:glycosyltransferase family 4 protein [Acetobacterium sp.]|jgi:glycosyltransferase involved in cell wall biosynthesis|uniref:glycosyltransferase family 4 protein n=1 Tax=Acetobacterium sp. TaxID=1872094 RepID=UPI000CB19488|nr:glycosyltransferase family 4 protein [Acetobacterium sp.]MDO9492580.1 glycosyltransferase family 4 protein [Acetobacterium sp.]PKM70996.1 MAG: glycosyltransferase family 1 protein [Firmicutes bacterium HGW-Firmicutes-17]